MNNNADQPRYYTVAEVAAILRVSDDLVLKQFGDLPGVIDLGVPERMHKRKKRVLRIPPETLEQYIRDKGVRNRRRR